MRQAIKYLIIVSCVNVWVQEYVFSVEDHEYSCIIELIGENIKKCEACRTFCRFFATSLINLIIHEHV